MSYNEAFKQKVDSNFAIFQQEIYRVITAFNGIVVNLFV